MEGYRNLDTEFQQRLESLRIDYESVTGRSWEHFFCPILYTDEKAELSRGHVINQKFSNSDRSWIPQRTHVDSFFGRCFEADFLAIDKKIGRSPFQIFSDKDLRRLFNPKFLLNGEEIDNYLPQPSNPVPENHLEVTLEAEGQSAPAILKPNASQRLAAKIGRSQIDVDKNVRIHALVPLLKAAHLTLFHIMGYEYALSPAGRFVGRSLLGDFYFKAQHSHPTDVVELAIQHFHNYRNMVQVAVPGSYWFKGTLTDRRLNLCVNEDRPWAYQTFVRTGKNMYLVMLPILENSQSSDAFDAFLQSPETAIDCRPVRLDSTGLTSVGKPHTMHWPGWEL